METDGRADDLELRRPGPDLYEAFVEMSLDFRDAGETRYQHPEGWTPGRYAAWLAELETWARGEALPPGKTAQETWWLVRGGTRIVGAARLRERLTDELRVEGGNIGYDVPPSQRRRGHGTEVLRRMRALARERGLARVLVTCNKDNTGSRRIIEANGGILEGEGISPKNGKAVLRFRVDTGPREQRAPFSRRGRGRP